MVIKIYNTGHAGIHLASHLSIYRVSGGVRLLSMKEGLTVGQRSWVARKTKDGIDQRFRAWDTGGNADSARGGMEHTIGEMAHQAQFLPKLYVREHGK